MSSNSRRLRIIVSLLLVGSMWTAGCGTDPGEELPEGGEVHAINLDNGEARDFDAEKLVPAGWAVCQLDDCSGVISRVRCNMLGPGACLLNVQCRLRLRCDIDIPVWMRPAEDVEQGGASTAESDPLPGAGSATQASYPVGCELICTPKSTISCEEIKSPNQCDAQPQCGWETICYDEPAGSAGSTESGQGAPADSSDRAPACDPEASGCDTFMPPMPPPRPPCTGVCRPSAPQPCEQLDKYTCERRDDCQWRPEALPLFDDESCSASDCGAPYSPFCQPKVVPTCREFAAPMPVCQVGQELVELFDDAGCLVGYKCVPVACPPLKYLAPLSCPDGQVPLRVLDDRGCVIRISCEPVECPAREPRMPQCANGAAPQKIIENGCLVGYECGSSCPAQPPKPDCSGNLKGIYRGECLAGWSCTDPIDPDACDQLVDTYNEALLAARRCGGATEADRSATGADLRAPQWNGLCSMTVASSLGCSSCPTYVNPANQEAIAKLNSLRKAFEQGQCFRNRACPAVMCLAPTGAACVSDGTGSGNGVCTDNQSRSTY